MWDKPCDMWDKPCDICQGKPETYILRTKEMLCKICYHNNYRQVLYKNERSEKFEVSIDGFKTEEDFNQTMDSAINSYKFHSLLPIYSSQD